MVFLTVKAYVNILNSNFFWPKKVYCLKVYLFTPNRIVSFIINEKSNSKNKQI